MATGRIGTTPALGFRWSESPAGGTTSLSGLDDNSVGLSYTPGNERVYRNGVLLSRGSDYTATDGTTITLEDATITGDIIEVFSQDLAQLTDAISKSSLTAKGTLLSASAASTLAVLGVGANDTVLTADSAETTGLKWATPAAPATSYALLNSGNTTVPSASTFNVTGLTSFNTYYVFFENVGHTNSGGEIFLRINGSTASNYNTYGFGLTNVTPSGVNLFKINQSSTTAITIGAMVGTNSISGSCEIRGGNSSGNKLYNASAAGNGSGNQHSTKAGFWNDATLITSITIATGTGNAFNSGSLFIYGGN